MEEIAMRTVPWLAVGVVGLASLPLFAQKVTNSSSASASRSATVQMQPVKAELQGKLNSKNAKAGDQVIVSTTEKVTTSEGVVIPRGTRLIGHVVSAQAQVKGQPGSQLAIAFDRAALKHGETVEIHAVILNVAPRIIYMPEPDESAGAQMGGGPGMASGGVAGGANSNMPGVGQGGMNRTGNGSGSVMETGPVTLDRAGSDPSTAPSDTMNAGTHGNDAASEAANATLGNPSSLGEHATTLPGVMLSVDVSGSASGVLTAKGHNVELDFGTRLVLGIAARK
jgi:hypothetical protein